jgi:hypothetical protein
LQEPSACGAQPAWRATSRGILAQLGVSQFGACPGWAIAKKREEPIRLERIEAANRFSLFAMMDVVRLQRFLGALQKGETVEEEGQRLTVWARAFSSSGARPPELVFQALSTSS